MALSKKTNTPTFENDDTVTNEKETVQETPQEATPDVEAAAKVEATTAIAKAQTTALGAAGGKKFTAALQDLEGQLDLDSVRALGVGTLPKLVADRGGFELGEGKEATAYGEWVNFQILSFNKRWLVSAGVDGEEGKELLRTSYDEQNLENETLSLKDYLQKLKEDGYEKASSRLYLDVWGFVVDSDKTGAIDESDYEMIQLQLSPSSVKQFTAYQIQAGIRASMTKAEVSNIVRATIDKREHGGNKYAAIKFSAA